jgi:acyl-CoA reductase-like NAD-dependent aldehyde dehydrogenase
MGALVGAYAPRQVSDAKSAIAAARATFEAGSGPAARGCADALHEIAGYIAARKDDRRQRQAAA